MCAQSKHGRGGWIKVLLSGGGLGLWSAHECSLQSAQTSRLPVYFHSSARRGRRNGWGRDWADGDRVGFSSSQWDHWNTACICVSVCVSFSARGRHVALGRCWLATRAPPSVSVLRLGGKLCDLLGSAPLRITGGFFVGWSPPAAGICIFLLLFGLVVYLNRFLWVLVWGGGVAKRFKKSVLTTVFLSLTAVWRSCGEWPARCSSSRLG